MEPYELTTCSFMVRFWVEEPATAGQRAHWHGHITHIPSGQHQDFEALDDMFSFMLPHLQAIGITLDNNPAAGESC